MADKYSNSSGSENGDSRNSSRSSASAEERLRRLFNSCDADGDGFLDGEDFTFMCRMLNLADAVEEIRRQLGMTEQSRISFEDFLRCRDHVMLEATLHHQVQPSSSSAVPQALTSTGEDTGVESDTSGMMGGNQPSKLMSWPTLSSDSLGALSCTKPESADYDSGARDLSPEPATLTLTQLIETHDPQALKQLRQSGMESCLDIANRLHMAALTSMKGELVELKNQVYRLAGDNRRLEELAHRQGDTSGINSHDFEQRLEQLTCRYEERIIELHSVIAELRKKVERHQINVIKEEDEEEESEQGQSFQSNDGESFNERDENNEISREFSRVVSEIETDLAARRNQLDSQSPSLEEDIVRAKFGIGTHTLSREKVEKANSASRQQSMESEANKGSKSPSPLLLKDGTASPQPQPPKAAFQKNAPTKREQEEEDAPPQLPPRTSRPVGGGGSSSMTSSLILSPDSERGQQCQRLESEARVLRADNEELRAQASRLEVELGQMSAHLERLAGERDALTLKVTELQQKLHSSAHLPASPSPHGHVTSPNKPGQSGGGHGERMSEAESYPVAKMAELKKLKTCASDKQILGSEVTIMGVQSTSTAEHLVQSLQDGSSIAELLRMNSSTSGGEKGGKRGKEVEMQEAVISEFEVELERRQAKIDHLKAQNDVLLATLEESRSQAERYSILMGKFESNNTALQLASSYCDQCLEAQDVLSALLETEMGVLLANCRAAGLGGLGSMEGEDQEQEEISSVLQRAHHARRRMEGVARHLTSRLDRTGLAGSGGGGGGGSLLRGSCQPWEDVGSTNSRTASTSSTSSSAELEFTKVEEGRLREHIQRLKAERAAVGSTVLGIESIHSDLSLYPTRPRQDAPRIDLENAVLMQELMAVKEEKAELKARSYLLEKEKRALELRLSGKETQEQAFRVHIEHLNGELQYLQQQQQQLQQQSSSFPPSLLSASSSSSSLSSSNSPKTSITTTTASKNTSSSSSSTPTGKLKSPNPNSNASRTGLQLPEDLQNQDPSQLARSLVQSQEREQTLKTRVSELASALEKISRNSESRHRQSSEFVGDLKRANAALISAFDKAKRKYQGRLKRLEGQLKALKDKYDLETASLREKYDLETGSLKHRISLMMAAAGGGGVGGKGSSPLQARPLPNETSL